MILILWWTTAGDRFFSLLLEDCVCGIQCGLYASRTITAPHLNHLSVLRPHAGTPNAALEFVSI